MNRRYEFFACAYINQRKMFTNEDLRFSYLILRNFSWRLFRLFAFKLQKLMIDPASLLSRFFIPAIHL